MKSLRMFRHGKFLPAFLFAATAIHAWAQTEYEAVPGMSGGRDFFVKAAKDLGITAPEGKHVAVLDHSWVKEDPETSQAPDHHNGWLSLKEAQLGGIKLKGKLFVPDDAQVPLKSLRIRIARPAPTGGWETLSEVAFPFEGDFGKWIDFEVDLPVEPEKSQETSKCLLIIAANPLAGPVYFDALHVLDAQNNELWYSPDFE